VSKGTVVGIAFVVAGMLAYFIGYGVGRYEYADPAYVTVSCPVGTVQIAKIDGVWFCLQEGETR
jgi:hypothetical protein